jgi:four helix bundle protein
MLSHFKNMENRNTFESLEIWKDGMNLCVQIYELMKNCKDFGLKDQIQRAAVSVPSNIAEGFERQTNKDFIQFLFIAKGSCGEVRTQLYLAKVLKYIDNETVNSLIEKTKITSSKIQNFIKSRRT